MSYRIIWHPHNHHSPLSKNNILTQELSIKKLLLIIQAFALILYSACNHNNSSQSKKENCNQLFVLFKGELNVKGYHQFIERQLLKNTSSGMAVLQTKISRASTYTAVTKGTIRLISEYVSNDSLFSYDSSDSTFIAISMKNIDYTDFDEVLLSSILLLQGHSETSDFKQAEMSKLLICEQAVTSKTILSYSIWTNNEIPLEIKKIKGEITYRERAIKYVCDTLIDPQIFQQPQGFRRILVSDFH